MANYPIGQAPPVTAWKRMYWKIRGRMRNWRARRRGAVVASEISDDAGITVSGVIPNTHPGE